MNPRPETTVPMPPARAAAPAKRTVSTRPLRAAIWILAYVLLVAFPLVVLSLGDMPRGGGYAWDFAMALGFGGLAMIALQSVLTARFRRATAPFGIDIIYYFHRWAAVAALGLVIGHYLLLRIRYAEAIGPVNPLVAPWQMTAGRIALGLFVILVVSSIWRKAFRIEYDRWRRGHAVMAVLAVVLAMAHIWGVGHYTEAAGKGSLWGAYTALWVLVVGYVRVVRPWSLLMTPYSVVDVRRERGTSWTIAVKPVGHSGTRFNAGQFAWLTLRASPFAAREHPFSIASSAADTRTLEFTIKELGDFTRTIKDVKVGDVAYVDGPHGVFSSDHYAGAEGFVFIAGGIGIAPIMSMLRTLAERRDPRPLRLVYGNRRWEDVVFREEIERLGSRLDLTVVHVLQEPPEDWDGLSGVLSEDVVRAALPVSTSELIFFVCGPKPMSDSVQRTVRRLGVPLHRVHCELFDMA
jgi:predicted ferric reductase